jgi:hypothetical protein
MRCEKCGRVEHQLFRDRPKGQRAKFVCYRCLGAEAPKPSDELLELSEIIESALAIPKEELQ